MRWCFVISIFVWMKTVWKLLSCIYMSCVVLFSISIRWKSVQIVELIMLTVDWNLELFNKINIQAIHNFTLWVVTPTWVFLKLNLSTVSTRIYAWFSGFCMAFVSPLINSLSWQLWQLSLFFQSCVGTGQTLKKTKLLWVFLFKHEITLDTKKDLNSYSSWGKGKWIRIMIAVMNADTSVSLFANNYYISTSMLWMLIKLVKMSDYVVYYQNIQISILCVEVCGCCIITWCLCGG